MSRRSSAVRCSPSNEASRRPTKRSRWPSPSVPTQEQLEKDANDANFYIASRARHLLEVIASRGRLEPTYPYPVEVWKLDGLTWIFLGGEVVVDYSLRIKRNLGIVAHLGLGVLQRRDGVHPVEAGLERRRL